VRPSGRGDAGLQPLGRRPAKALNMHVRRINSCGFGAAPRASAPRPSAKPQQVDNAAKSSADCRSAGSRSLERSADLFSRRWRGAPIPDRAGCRGRWGRPGSFPTGPRWLAGRPPSQARRARPGRVPSPPAGCPAPTPSPAGSVSHSVEVPDRFIGQSSSSRPGNMMSNCWSAVFQT
jgi:hypothetical protein